MAIELERKRRLGFAFSLKQIAQVNRLRILELVVTCSILLCVRLFVASFLFFFYEDLKNSKSFLL